MCGIAGVLCWNDADTRRAESAIRTMLPALRHRGPDGEAVWLEQPGDGVSLAMAHTRLAIIDLSEAGRQPMVRRGRVITYNGEVYNHRSLRKELEDRGSAFTTSSDTEVVLNALECWGDDAVHRLAGMFAFAAWESRDRRLLLVRDRLGIKPLYYYRGQDFLVFASEVRTLLASGLVPRRLAAAGLWHYLGYQTTPTPTTLVDGVRMLGAGQALSVDSSGSATIRTYWQPGDGQPAVPAASREVVRRRVGELLQAAVDSHLVSDVPVGVFLSGGIDSGALVSVLSAIGARPATFTVTLDEPRFDESAAARAIAAHYGTDHHELRVSSKDILDTLPPMLDAVDHPSGDGVNTYVVSQAVRHAGYKVALSGLGGDELFGGYPSFRRLERLVPMLRGWRSLPRSVRRVAADVVLAGGRGHVGAAKAAAVLESDGTVGRVWPVTRQLFSRRERRMLLRAEQTMPPAAADSYDDLLGAGRRSLPDTWTAVSVAEVTAYMHDVLLRDTDQMSMAHALEVRVPLLDHRLVEYVIALPSSFKRDGIRQKPLLVDSVPLPFPDDHASLSKKGFTLPFDVWMRGPLRRLCERQLGDQGLEGRGLFLPGKIDRLWRRYQDGHPGVTWSRLWALVVFNAWVDRNGIECRAVTE